MMKTFAIMSDDGTYPTSVWATNIAHLSAPEGTVDAPEGAETMMFVNGFWIQRPVVPDPVVIGKMIRFEGIPDGASCEVLDRDYAYVAAVVAAESGVIEFQIDDAGSYQLDVSVPLPWLAKTWTVVIE
jgi:hypothetical protein